MNWMKKIICKIRKTHKMDYYSDVCVNCGYERQK